ncbi:MAG: NUDIX domain-containing protein [Erysipelotrichaceae bacterium]|nr:NUDIX domain-containing protein [Erysipelotrichaceae bacterium]
MKRELGIGRCGLACCLCSENGHCRGCNSGQCPDREWCENRRCCLERKLGHCYECEEECSRGLLNRIKPRAFTLFARRYGIQTLLDCLERNEGKGVIYHRQGISGDYDDFSDVESLMAFLWTGRREPETVSIVGKNYLGSWNTLRVASRAIIREKDRILLSYERHTGQYALPGGGKEEGESPEECCIRETAEETGTIIRISPCVVEITEYYEEWKGISRYYLGTIAGSCERKLTETERKQGTEPRWLTVEQALKEFSRHAEFAETDEMRRGLYLREHTALSCLFAGGDR